MIMLLAALALVALLLVLALLTRTPLARRWRKRVLENDQRYRDTLKPTRPWDDDYRREW